MSVIFSFISYGILSNFISHLKYMLIFYSTKAANVQGEKTIYIFCILLNFIPEFQNEINVRTCREDRVLQDIERSMCMSLALVHSVAMRKFLSCIYESGKIVIVNCLRSHRCLRLICQLSKFFLSTGIEVDYVSLMV